MKKMLKNIVSKLTKSIRVKNYRRLYNAVYGYFYEKNQLSAISLLTADVLTRKAIAEARAQGRINWLYEVI